LLCAAPPHHGCAAALDRLTSFHQHTTDTSGRSPAPWAATSARLDDLATNLRAQLPRCDAYTSMFHDVSSIDAATASLHARRL
jgi:hypothetical protein